jgi:pimeloyl-ACP methyl ester carboxylesterase
MPTVDVNGRELFYADDDFSDPWREPEAVFLQPYVFGSHRDFRAWVPQLSRHFRVIRADRYGLGCSAVPDANYKFTLDAVLDDFEALLDSLGIESVHFIGESLGGVFGAAFAARNADRVRTLILCSTPRRLLPEVQRVSFALDGYDSARAALDDLGTPRYFRRLGVADRLSREPGANRLMSEYRVELASQVAPQVVAGLIEMVAGVDITSTLLNIQAPTLLLTPARSAVSSLEEQKAMREQIAGSEQVILDSEHHIAWFEADRCAAEALSFITRHSS